MRPQDEIGRRARLLLALALVAALAVLAQFSLGSGPGPNYRNYTVDARVNITGSVPYVIAVSLQDGITLTAGGLTTVTCNVSVRDYNSWNDIRVVNATLFAPPDTESSPENNNTHYTNTSCAAIPGQQSGIFANYTCTFPVNYYAVSGGWNCTARVNDSTSLTDVGTDNATIYALYALNVTDLIDYGDMTAGEYTPNRTANVTNFGNSPINITVLGYANSTGDGLSFICEYGNLSIDLHRFAANSTAPWAEKQPLNTTFKQIYGLTVPKTTSANYSVNATYWELFVDSVQPAAGKCNGTIVFQAESA